MAGRFTRKIYDNCAQQQNTKQSTDPLELVLDVNKYVHCNNACVPSKPFEKNAAQLVDIESSLWGIDKLASDCDSAKHPFCAPNGCLLTNDPRIAPFSTPFLCDRGRVGDHAVVTTNMRMPQTPGYKVPNQHICPGNKSVVQPGQLNSRTQTQTQTQTQPRLSPGPIQFKSQKTPNSFIQPGSLLASRSFRPQNK